LWSGTEIFQLQQASALVVSVEGEGLNNKAQNRCRRDGFRDIQAATAFGGWLFWQS
jgi:hypothetical protein